MGNVTKTKTTIIGILGLALFAGMLLLFPLMTQAAEKISDTQFKAYCGPKDSNNKVTETAWCIYTDTDGDKYYDKMNINGSGQLGIDFDFINFPTGYGAKIEEIHVNGVSNMSNIRLYTAKKLFLSDSVKTIDDWALASESYLEEITAPAVVTIGQYALNNCRKLKSFTFADSVTSVGNYAFQNCVSLEKVTFGKQIDTISEGCFSGCTALKDLTIPSTIKTIGKIAFSGCTFSQIYFEEGVETIKEGALANNNNLKNVLFPNSLKTLGAPFSKNNGLTEIIIPGNVKEISGMYIASSCENLKKIVLEEGCPGTTSLVSDCPNLDTVILPSTFTDPIGGTYYIVRCPLLKTAGPNAAYNIQYNWKNEIPKNAFSQVASLEEVVIGGNIKTIGETAFFQCKGLKKVTIGNSVETIEAQAFRECALLERVTFDDQSHLKLIKQSAFLDCVALPSIIIPKSVEEIEKSAFNGDTALKSVTLNSENTIFGERVFCNCPELKTAGPKGDGNTYNIIFVDFTKIPDHVLDQCNGLGMAVIPNTVTAIGAYAFYQCKNLTDVIIPNSVKHIGNAAFSGCAINKIPIPTEIEYIGSWAFSGNPAQERLEFPLTLLTLLSGAVPAGSTVYGYDNSPSDVSSYGYNYVSLGKACAIYFKDTKTNTETKKYVLQNGPVGKMPIPENSADGKKFECWMFGNEPLTTEYNVGERASINAVSKYSEKTNPSDPGGNNGGNNNNQGANSGGKDKKPGGKEQKPQLPKVGTVNNKNIAVKAGVARITITAKKTGKISGYVVRYKTGAKKWKVFKVKGNKNLKVKVKKLKRNKKYKFQIRTYRISGKKIVYSKWSKQRTVRVK